MMSDQSESGMDVGRNYSSGFYDGLDRRNSPKIDTDQSISCMLDGPAADRLLRLGIVASEVTVLPRNFDTAISAEHFVFEEMTGTIRTLGRQVGLKVDIPGPTAFVALHEKDAEIISPVLVFAHAFLVEGGAALVYRFLELLSNHIASRWGPKIASSRVAVLEVVVTCGQSSKRLKYRGPISGLPTVVEAAQVAFSKVEE